MHMKFSSRNLRTIKQCQLHIFFYISSDHACKLENWDLANVFQENFFCRTTGNGNCLYNASSIALTGNESLADFLRALTCAEPYLNANYYVDHPYFVALEKPFKLNQKSSFMDSLLQHALDNYTIGDYKSAVHKEAESNSSNAQYSSFLCLLALSTVIGQPIESHCPVVIDDWKNIESLRKTEKIRNGCIMPRTSPGSEDKFIFFNVPQHPLSIYTQKHFQ